MEETFVQLNTDIGYYLLKFIDGIDVVNFIEAVNESHQFRSIAKFSDHHFIRIFKELSNHSKILLPRTQFESFTSEYDVDNEHLFLISKCYSNVIEPSIRLYIHPCFSIEGFAKLCEIYKTPIFSCYSRLLPLNTVCHNYNSDFGLLDYEYYGHTIGAKRILNDREKALFNVNSYFKKNKNEDTSLTIERVRTVDEFKNNLITRFSSDTWLPAIDFSKWVIVGGCVLNALCRSPFEDTKEQDINLVYYMNDIFGFNKSIEHTVCTLKALVSKHLKDEIKVEGIPGKPDYNVFLPGQIRLNFTLTIIENSKDPLSHILHNLDTDICQVAFTGSKIISTFSFLQAIATRTFFVYSLHARSPKHLCERIARYCNRGFHLIVAKNFDGNFNLMMAQDEIPSYRIEQIQYIDEDGEVQFATKESHRAFLDNVDTYRLQENFTELVFSQSN